LVPFKAVVDSVIVVVAEAPAAVVVAPLVAAAPLVEVPAEVLPVERR
jgi:hypothetical protein